LAGLKEGRGKEQGRGCLIAGGAIVATSQILFFMKGWLKMKKVLLAGCVVLALAAAALAGNPKGIFADGAVTNSNTVGTGSLTAVRSGQQWQGTLSLDSSNPDGHWAWTATIISAEWDGRTGTTVFQATITENLFDDPGITDLEVRVGGDLTPHVYAWVGENLLHICDIE